MTTRFIQISDTHLGPTPDYKLMEYNTYSHAEHLVTCINSLDAPFDFVVHTGDVVDAPDDPAGYALAAELFGRLEVPIFFANGNHDRAAQIAQLLPIGPHNRLSSDELCYTFEVNGERFIVLDGQADDALAPRGVISAEQLTHLTTFLAADTTPATVFLHYPAFSLNSAWMDHMTPWFGRESFMQLSNGADFHAALLPFRDRLRGVFHGHLHRPFQLSRDGITYFGGPSAFAHFLSFPNTTMPTVDVDTRPGFNYVQLHAEHMTVQFFGV